MLREQKRRGLRGAQRRDPARARADHRLYRRRLRRRSRLAAGRVRAACATRRSASSIGRLALSAPKRRPALKLLGGVRERQGRLRRRRTARPPTTSRTPTTWRCAPRCSRSWDRFEEWQRAADTELVHRLASRRPDLRLVFDPSMRVTHLEFLRLRDRLGGCPCTRRRTRRSQRSGSWARPQRLAVLLAHAARPRVVGVRSRAARSARRPAGIPTSARMRSSATRASSPSVGCVKTVASGRSMSNSRHRRTIICIAHERRPAEREEVVGGPDALGAQLLLPDAGRETAATGPSGGDVRRRRAPALSSP